jgi:hypothetical protein
MHDLLVDRETKTLADIVYPVAAGEHAAIAAICGFLPRTWFVIAFHLFPQPHY